MAIPSFYHPALTVDDVQVELSQAEGRHAIKSRRLRVGQQVNLLNGGGLFASGEIVSTENRAVSVNITNCEQRKRLTRLLTVATAVPKGDRQKTMVDMLTQLGVHEIIPLLCEHSVTRFGANTREKWLRTAVESIKQSHNPWLPVIHESQLLPDLLAKQESTFVYADTGGKSMNMLADNHSELTVLIGPEGGFSASEIDLFAGTGVGAVALGPYILRTEAAAVAAISQWSHKLHSAHNTMDS